MLNKIKNLILKIKSIFIKPKLQPMGSTIIPNATIIKTDDETNPLDVDLVDDNISNKDKKELRTFTKKWVDRILTISLFDIQLCFVLAFMGKENIAESLGIAMATEIVGTIAGYYAKSFFETYSEKKNDIEMEKIHKDYETITPNVDDDNTNAFG